MDACQVIPTTERFAPGILAFLDCQAETLGARGYLALAAPGSSVSIALGSMLTLFVAFIGYRMLLGQTPTLRDGVLSFVKLGVVLALATGWPAYQALVYNVALHAPGELVADIGTPAGLPGSNGGLAERLDGADQAFQALAIYGVGALPPVEPGGQSATPMPPAPWIGFDTFALGASRALFLAGAIGAFAFVRIGAGLLLALGPLFIAFLLFQGTRGLFEGWVRGLAGAAFGALATAIVLGVQLALLEPWLVDLLNRRAADLAIVGAPAQLLAVTTVFVVVLAAIIAVTTRVALGFKLPIAWPDWSFSSAIVNRVSQVSTRATTVAPVPIESRSRAAAIADAVSISQRRETLALEAAGAAAGGAASAPGRRVSVNATAREMAGAGSAPLGQSYRRRTANRTSARAGARDRAS